MSALFRLSTSSLFFLPRPLALGALLLFSTALLAAVPTPPRPDGRAAPLASGSDFTTEPPVNSSSISLHEAIRRALRNSPELKAFAWSAEGALARVRQAALWPNPEIELERENFGGSGAFSGSGGAEDTLALAQLLPLGGDLKQGRRLAAAERDRAAWDYHVARLGVVLDTSHRYIAALASARRLDLARRELEVARKLESITGKRIEIGEASPVERARVAVPTVTAELTLARAELANTAARQRLALSWGERSLAEVRLTSTLEELTPLPAPAALVRTINRSPAVARWAAEISARKAALGLARAEAIPDPILRVGVKQDRRSNDHSLIVGISLPLPIFDRKQGDRNAAAAAQRAAEENRRAAELQVESALSSAYFALAVAHAESTALRERALPAANEAYTASLKAFGAGLLLYLDVLDASRTLLDLERRQVDALAAYHTARAGLTALLGGELPVTNTNNLQTTQKQK